MNQALAFGYEGVARLARALSAIAPQSDRKLVATFASRRDVMSRFAAFAHPPCNQGDTFHRTAEMAFHMR